MTGLEKILQSIDDEATKLFNKTIKKANKEAEDILEKAKEIAENESKLIIKNAEDEAKLILEKAESQIELQKREMILKTKREQIDYIMDETKNTLCQMPEDEYFKIILKLCKNYLQPNNGEIVFSERDIKRLPKDFETNILKLAKSVGGNIKISEQTRDINGGFILVYGDIEENCSFDALFESSYDLLSDKINELLFS